MRTLYNVVGLTRRAPSVYAEYNIHSQQTQSLARHDDDYGINTSIPLASLGLAATDSVTPIFPEKNSRPF